VAEVVARVVRVLAAQAREPGVVVRALPAEPVRPQPEELTRDQALEASARAEDPPTPAGRVTPTLIGPCRESSLCRDRGIRRPLLALSRLLRASTPTAGICRATPINCGNGPWPPHCRHRSHRIRLVRHASGVRRPPRDRSASSVGTRRIDIKPAVACLQRCANGRRPVVRRCGVPALHDRRARSAALVLAVACSHARCPRRQCGVPPIS
jgi:hypothetical protein